MVKIKIFRVKPGLWRILAPVLRRNDPSVMINEMRFAGYAATGEEAIRFAVRDLRSIRDYLAAGWVAEE